jgi:hypothetical protein
VRIFEARFVTRFFKASVWVALEIPFNSLIFAVRFR